MCFVFEPRLLEIPNLMLRTRKTHTSTISNSLLTIVHKITNLRPISLFIKNQPFQQKLKTIVTVSMKHVSKDFRAFKSTLPDLSYQSGRIFNGSIGSRRVLSLLCGWFIAKTQKRRNAIATICHHVTGKREGLMSSSLSLKLDDLPGINCFQNHFISWEVNHSSQGS